MIETPSIQEFKTITRRIFRKGNPGVKATIKWVRKPEVVIWADGTEGLSGTIEVMAPGYKTKRLTATWLRGAGVSLR